ncbi:Protein CBG25601 [Caenorhabditis briggsae]|uniref:Protein CBG25601 n=1 Tax=Caenorhabditis briggsae TaxID=6238 RepID=B6IF85_CAEBR|nr:Protein CBG25601 [Caenorhabditis briggsae]CAR98565.1 Protein CBG25601 [Caenorhabditis briggsae]
MAFPTYLTIVPTHYLFKKCKYASILYSTITSSLVFLRPSPLLLELFAPKSSCHKTKEREWTSPSDGSITYNEFYTAVDRAEKRDLL